MNKIIVTGNVGKAPEMNYTPSGTAVTKFSVAISEGYGEKRTTQWLNIVCWNQLAETMGDLLKSGTKVLVEGRLSVRDYTDREGNKRKAVEIIANNIEFLSGKKADEVEQESDEEHPF